MAGVWPASFAVVQVGVQIAATEHLESCCRDQRLQEVDRVVLHLEPGRDADEVTI